jgi:hypothetical protein
MPGLSLGTKQLTGMSGGEIIHKLRYCEGTRWLKADSVSRCIWSRLILVFTSVSDWIFLFKLQLGFAQKIGLEVRDNRVRTELGAPQ